MYKYIKVTNTNIKEDFMKKYILVLVALVMFLTGCVIGDATPSDEVRDFLNRYKENDTVIVNELNDYLSNTDYTEDQRKDYKDVYLRQYSNLEYDIKDEVINGDKAVVTVQIKVFDYYKTNTTVDDYFVTNNNEFVLEDGLVDNDKMFNYRLNKLLSTTNTVEYTMEINLTKVDGNWEVQALSQDDLNKLHGVFEY